MCVTASILSPQLTMEASDSVVFPFFTKDVCLSYYNVNMTIIECTAHGHARPGICARCTPTSMTRSLPALTGHRSQRARLHPSRWVRAHSTTFTGDQNVKAHRIYDRKKSSSPQACAASELSEEARLAGGEWIPLLPEGHRGISELKWCTNRFTPFLVIDPIRDTDPGERDAEGALCFSFLLGYDATSVQSLSRSRLMFRSLNSRS